MSAEQQTAGILIRQLAPADLPTVEAILKHSPEAAQWSRSTCEGLHRKGQLAWLAEVHGSVVGLLVARAITEEAEILNLAVDPAKRRRGYARALLNHAVAELARSGVHNIFLEVRESNLSAIQFYQSLGFRTSGRRTGYYRDPHEAAVCLWKQITHRTKSLLDVASPRS